MRSLIYSIFAGIRRCSLAVWHDQAGISAIVLAIFLPALVAFTALAIDMSYAYWTRTQLQHAASAAALAGASQLNAPTNTEALVKAEAIDYANHNLPTALHGTTLLNADVVLGNWDSDCAAIAVTRADRALCFTQMGDVVGNACSNPVPAELNPNCLIIDAVKATTRRRELVNNNPLNLFLASAIGLAQTDINTSAIAWNGGGFAAPVTESNCYNNGILSGNMVYIQGANAFGDDFCVYGHCGIEISQDNSFTEGTSVAIGPVDAASCSPLPPILDTSPGENCDPDTGLDCIEEVFEGNMEEAVLPMIALEWSSAPAGLFTTMEFGDGANPAPTFPVLPSLTHSLDAVTLASSMTWQSWDKDRWKEVPTCESDGQITDYYVVPVGVTADITGPLNICDVAIIADDFNVGEGNLNNVLLVTRPWGSNCEYESETHPNCYKDANIYFGSDSTLENVAIISRGDVEFQGYTTLGGAACEAETTTVEVFAMGDVYIQSNATITNATIAAGHDVRVESNATINLSGADTTIQAVHDVILQSDGSLGACPDEDGDGGNDSEDEVEPVVLRLVD